MTDEPDDRDREEDEDSLLFEGGDGEEPQGNGLGPSLLERFRTANESARRERDRRRVIRLQQRLARSGQPVGEMSAGAPSEEETTEPELEVPGGDGDDGADRPWEESATPVPFRLGKVLRPGVILGALAILALIAYPLDLLPGLPPDAVDFDSLFRFVLPLAIIVIGLNLVAGFTGQLSLGQSIFTAVGGYASAILSTKYIEGHGGPWFGLIVAVAVSVLVAIVLALPSLRVRGAYLAIVTLAFVPIFQRVFKSGPESFFGGFGGIKDIRTPTIVDPSGGVPVDSSLFPPWGGSVLTTVDYYFLTLGLFVILFLVARNIVKSRWGRAFMAIRESEIAAKSSGVNVYRFKITAFAISAFYAGVGGWLYVHSVGFIAPEFPAFIPESFRYVVIMIVGGTGTLLGPVVGSFAIEGVRRATTNLLELQNIILGGLAIFTVVTAPSGLVGMFRTVGEKARKAFTGRERPPSEWVPLAQSMKRPQPREIRDLPEDTILETREMSKIFGGLRANDKISIRVRKGTVHALIGPNGSGKTTFINVLTGVYEPEEGEVWFLGRKISGKPPHVTVHMGMGRTFQNLQLWRRMAVMDNVMVGLHVRGRSGLLSSAVRAPRALREEQRLRQRAMGLLEFVGLRQHADVLAGQLAYGEQRRLEVARALALDPAFLILDEPAAGLNPAEVAAFTELIRKVRDAGITVFLIEHHMDLVMAVADEISVLDYGKKIAEGRPQEVAADPRVIEAYLGTEAEAADVEEVKRP